MTDMRARTSKTAASQPSNSELFRRYCEKAEIIHRFAENLAQTLGVFHGINETGKKLSIDGEPSAALVTILFDQMQVMVIRICALCGNGNRKDDASIGELVRGLSDPIFQQYLIDKEKRWEQAVGHRAGFVGEIPRFTKVLRMRLSALDAQTEALDRIRHYRNKVLAHATTGLDPNNKVLVRDVWRVSRLVLSVAKYLRLVLERKQWDYLEHSDDGKAHGRALVRALHRDSNAQT
jgi:hypothetical protein